jgi:hypothetical protein
VGTEGDAAGGEVCMVTPHSASSGKYLEHPARFDACSLFLRHGFLSIDAQNICEKRLSEPRSALNVEYRAEM